MRLFACTYLDEDVSVLIATLLKARGLEAMTARDEGMLYQDDPVHLAHAVTLQCCMVTHNRVHFEELHREYLETDKKHPGIIVATRRSPYEVARRLIALLNTIAADELENQLIYI